MQSSHALHLHSGRPCVEKPSLLYVVLAQCLPPQSCYLAGKQYCIIATPLPSYLCMLSLCRISLAACSSCVLYAVTDSVCTSAHPPCSYVQLYGNLTLVTTESLVDVLFSHVDNAVKNGSLAQSCGELFPLLYCHQVYKQCRAVTSNSTSPVYESGSLCDNDCLEVMSACEFDWLFLTNLVESLVSPHLPSLMSGCITDGSTAEENCTPLRPGM